MDGAAGGRPLSEQLQAAYRQQLSENQASMSNFVNTVATLCESFTVDGPSIGSALRRIDKVEQIEKVMPSAVTTIGGIPTLGGPITPRDHRGPSTPRKPAIADDGIAIPESFVEDAMIKRLPFISKDGQIEKPVPILQRLLGSKYRSCVEGFKSTLSGWHPIGGAFGSIVTSQFFQLISALVICANFYYIVLQSDFKVTNLHEETPATMSAIGHAFTCWYTFELLCNMAASGREFLLGPDTGWNLFDFGIVAVSWFEVIVESLGGNAPNSSFLRIIRFMRISRVLRMFSAMRMFKEIKIMVDCLAGSLSIFFFCTIMFGLFLSLFAVFFVQGLGAYLEGMKEIDPLEAEPLLVNFGTCADAMLSLFICATGGDDWRIYYDIIKVIGIQYNWLFLIFVDFYLFAFVNVVVGVFCEKACALSAPSTSELMARRYEQEFADANELFDLLDKHMENDGGPRMISVDKFQHFIDDPEVERYFECRGLKVSSATRFFKMLCDLHETDMVDYPTFVSAVVLLDGQASCIDMHVICVRQLHGLHQLHAILDARHDEVTKGTMSLQNQLHDLKTSLQTGMPNIPPAAAPAPANNNFDLNSSLHSSFAPLGAQLSAIEAEIKELKALTASPIQSREPSRTPFREGFSDIGGREGSRALQQGTPDVNRNLMKGVQHIPSNLSKDMTDTLSVDGHAQSIPFNNPPKHVMPDSNAFSQGMFDKLHHSEAALVEKDEQVKLIQKKLENAQQAARLSSDALSKSGLELETAKQKCEQLQRLVTLQDQREAELQTQLSQLRDGHDAEITRLERAKADLKDLVQRHEWRISELQSELASVQMRAQQRGGGMFGFGECGTSRPKDQQMIS